jgi:hypothetical protein
MKYTHWGIAGSAKLWEETITINVENFIHILIVPHHQNVHYIGNRFKCFKHSRLDLLFCSLISKYFLAPYVVKNFLECAHCREAGSATLWEQSGRILPHWVTIHSLGLIGSMPNLVIKNHVSSSQKLRKSVLGWIRYRNA